MMLVIDAVGASTGGNITILNNILYYLSELDENLTITVFIEESPSKNFYLYSNNNIKITPIQNKSLVQKIMWQQFQLHKRVQAEYSDVIILSITNVVSFFPKVKQIVYFHQGLLFIKNNQLFRFFKLSYIIRFKILKLFVILGFYKANAIVTQTKHIKKSIINQFPKLEDKIFTVYSGTPKVFVNNISNYKLPLEIKDDFKIIYISHPSEYKNFDILFETAKLAKAKNIKFKFLLTLDINTTDSRYKYFIDKFQTIIETYDISDYIYFMGVLKNSKEIEEAYLFADVVIHPSFVESFPQTFTESMQLSKPLISIDLPYAKEIAEDASLYFRPNSASDLLEKILFVKNNQNLSELSKKSLKRSEFFEPKIKWLELYTIIKNVSERKIKK